jgi:hypothetical protein
MARKVRVMESSGGTGAEGERNSGTAALMIFSTASSSVQRYPMKGIAPLPPFQPMQRGGFHPMAG